MTTAIFKETDDLEAGIKTEFPNGTLADWDDFKKAESSSPSELKAFLDEIGMKRTGSAHCLQGGSRKW